MALPMFLHFVKILSRTLQAELQGITYSTLRRLKYAIVELKWSLFIFFLLIYMICFFKLSNVADMQLK